MRFRDSRLVHVLREKPGYICRPLSTSIPNTVLHHETVDRGPYRRLYMESNVLPQVFRVYVENVAHRNASSREFHEKES